MTPEDFQFLLSPDGQHWLAEIGQTPITPQNHLQLVTFLRRELPAAQAQAVLETVLLRQEAVTKFSRAAQMYFTRPALEQATSEVVSRYRAQRFAQLGSRAIFDLGCSIGGDALALTDFAEVTGVEWDLVRLLMAQENVRAYGNGERFHPLQADLLSMTPFAADALFFDPARRDEQGRRFFSVHDYQPPLSLIDRWRELVPETAVKISPGVDYAELPDDAEVEFISVNGEVKEGVLWYGRFQTTQRRATLLPDNTTLTTDDLPSEPVPITQPKAYLYEPDGAVIRAHLVEALAPQLQASKLSDDIAYLTSDTAVETPFARCFAIQDHFPFQLKQLRHYLREHSIGQVVIKKRGSPLEPAQLMQQLRLKGNGDESCIIFLTQIQGEAAVLIGQEQKKASGK